MTSPQMIKLIEKKLRAHGIKKIVPDKTLLAEAYTEFEKGRRLQERITSSGWYSPEEWSGVRCPRSTRSAQ